MIKRSGMTLLLPGAYGNNNFKYRLCRLKMSQKGLLGMLSPAQSINWSGFIADTETNTTYKAAEYLIKTRAGTTKLLHPALITWFIYNQCKASVIDN